MILLLQFYEATIWGHGAPNVAESLAKGTGVIVAGGTPLTRPILRTVRGSAGGHLVDGEVVRDPLRGGRPGDGALSPAGERPGELPHGVHLEALQGRRRALLVHQE